VNVCVVAAVRRALAARAAGRFGVHGMGLGAGKRILPLFYLTSKGPVRIKPPPCRPLRGAISFLAARGLR